MPPRTHARFYGDNHEADARLIAQAPAMAEVLRQTADAIGVSNFTREKRLQDALTSIRAILRAIEEG